MNSINIIKEIYSGDLQQGKAWDLYNEGVKAFHLIEDERIQNLWDSLNNTPFDIFTNPFWEKSLINLAKNHVSSQMNIGDMIRFLPKNWGHFARKVMLFKESSDDEIKTIPGGFFDGVDLQGFPQSMLEIAWDLASDILKTCLPINFKIPKYAVSVEVLKYSNSMSELQELFDLLQDSDSGSWTNLGRKMDIYRGKIISESPFDKSVFTKIYKYGSRMPGINLLLNSLNQRVFNNYSNPDNAEVVGPPHIDTIRFQTLLAGDRDSIITEIYDGKNWYEIPLSTNSIYFFPGKFLSKETGIRPTFHRYSIRKSDNTMQEIQRPNVTLLLGLVDATKFRSLSKHSV